MVLIWTWEQSIINAGVQGMRARSDIVIDSLLPSFWRFQTTYNNASDNGNDVSYGASSAVGSAALNTFYVCSLTLDTVSGASTARLGELVINVNVGIDIDIDPLTITISFDGVGFGGIGAWKNYQLTQDGDVIESDPLTLPPLNLSFWTLTGDGRIQNGRLELGNGLPDTDAGFVSHITTVIRPQLATARDHLGRIISATDISDPILYSAAPLGNHGWLSTGLSGRGVAIISLPTGKTKIYVGSTEATFEV